MVVCKFFLQGNCKFGTMCKFEHEINKPSTAYNTGTSILRTSNFNSVQLAQPKNNSNEVDTNRLVSSVISDMTQAEKGGQWLFSSYAPFKEKPAFPGFEDQSFEEIRLGYYEALKTGTVEQFKQQLQNMLQSVVLKVRSLQNPSPEIVNMLTNIYNTPANTFSTSSSNFTFKSGGINQQNTTSIFGQTKQNMFGNSSQPQQMPSSIFSNAGQNVFTANNQSSQNIFAAQPQPSQQNVFGHPVHPQSSASSIFSQASNAQSSNSVFGGQQMPASNSIFNNNANIYSPQIQQGNIFQPVSQTPNIFGSQNVMQNPLLPADANKNPLLGTSNSNKTVLSAPTNVFNINQTNQYLQHNTNQNSQPQFNQQSLPNQAPTFSASNSVFTTSVNQASQSHSKSSFGSVDVPHTDLGIYSKMEDLTEEEIKWFQSNDLDISKIPDKPPTYEMCF